MTHQPEIYWICKSFEDLSTAELYAILKLRSAVFVVEQKSIYQDVDDKDFSSYHLMGWKEEKLAAYTRLLPPGLSYKTPSIGRVVVAADQRAFGYGKLLMLKSVEQVYELFGHSPITISAQFYLKKFYESLSFQQVSAIYDEDGIPHIKMVKNS